MMVIFDFSSMARYICKAITSSNSVILLRRMERTGSKKSWQPDQISNRGAKSRQ